MTTASQRRAQVNRGTLFVEDAEVVSVEEFPGSQFVLRLRAPACANQAEAGNFVHITCHEELPMRRPLSIMRVVDDSIDVLFKIVGHGLQHLAARRPGEAVSVLGPIGVPFRAMPERPNALLIGGGVGIPPMVFLADVLRLQADSRPLAILGSEIPFPFDDARSALPAPWIEAGIDRTMPLLENWGIPCRLASNAGFDGCFEGFVTDLATRWLDSLSSTERARTAVYSCGPTPMLKAVANLAKRYSLPCQVSLEEYMACAVGGCAGCTVRVRTPAGDAMQRVCVDGPVFDAASVVW